MMVKYVFAAGVWHFLAFTFYMFILYSRIACSSHVLALNFLARHLFTHFFALFFFFSGMTYVLRQVPEQMPYQQCLSKVFKIVSYQKLMEDWNMK